MSWDMTSPAEGYLTEKGRKMVGGEPGSVAIVPQTGTWKEEYSPLRVRYGAEN